MTVEIKRRFRRSVGFRFDAMAVWLMCQQYGVDLNTMDNIPKEEYVSSWVWSAHRSFCLPYHPFVNKDNIVKCYKPIPYERMKRFIPRMRKSEWDMLLQAMIATKAPEDDKKKAQPGENSSSQDGRQD